MPDPELDPTLAPDNPPQEPSDPEDSTPSPHDLLVARDARIGDLEATLTQRDQALSQVHADLEAAQSQASQAQEQLGQAIERWRQTILESNPEIPPDLLQGATVQELDAALQRGRELVERVRARLEDRQAQERIPVGAPPRSTAPNLSSLSPHEKIALALSQRR